MILVRVRDHDAQKVGIGLLKTLDRVKRKFVGVVRIERQAHVQDNPLPLRFDLDAGAANLFGSPVDADPRFCSTSPFAFPQLSISR